MAVWVAAVPVDTGLGFSVGPGANCQTGSNTSYTDEA